LIIEWALENSFEESVVTILKMSGVISIILKISKKLM